MLNNVIDEGLIYQQLIVVAEVGKIFTKEAINYPHILKILSQESFGSKKRRIFQVALSFSESKG